MDRQDPLPRWAWPVMCVALLALALFAWSLRLQQDRSLEVRDPDSLIGPAELVEMGYGSADGPFVHDGRLAIPLFWNECPHARVDLDAVGDTVRIAMRVTHPRRDCSSQRIPWAVLMTPEDPSLLDRTIEIVPIDETPPRPDNSDIPFGTWSPPYPGSSSG